MTNTIFVTMVNLDCAECGLIFSITQDFYDRRRKDHQGFYCPMKHRNYYYQQTTEEKLEKELSRTKESLKRSRLEAEFNERSRRAYKGKLNHVKKKISMGECPCCGSVFKNLRRHIQRKHPDYNQEA